ncbi:MAG: MFS transporter [Dehalococcoidia bacterium]|nr:MFS transporter [Dehalococcoidia bacterium]
MLTTKTKASPSFILFWATLSLFFAAFSFSSYSLFLPEFLREFRWNRSDVAIPFSLAMIVWGITQPVAGALADARGTRPVILGGILLMALGFIVMSFAQDLWQIALGFGALIGIATSACGSISFGLLISKWFTGARRGSAMGILQAATPASPIVLAPVVFLAMTTFGWRFAALGLGLFLLFVTFPLAYLKIHDPETRTSAASASEKRGTWREVLMVVRRPPMRNLFISRFACGLSFLLIPVLAVAGMESGLSQAQGALAVSVYGASSAVGAVAGGLAADHWGRVRTLVATYLVRGIGALALGLFVMDALWFYLAVALAAGPIFATVAVNNVQVFEMAGARRAGLILGLGLVLHQVAAALGPYVSGLIFDWTGTYRISFLGLGVVLLLAVIPASRTKPEAPNVQPSLAVPSVGTKLD